jgi:MFS family permease
MLATILIFSGHFAFFTYLRPFLETVAQASVEGVSLILLGFGVANFIGTSIAGHLLARSLRLTLALVPLAMSVLALMMVTFGHVALLDGLLVAMWGFAFGLVPVGWSTWLATTVPDEAESAGGLLVASIQLAISAGAAGGGAVFDLNGASGVFVGSGVLLVSAMVIVLFAVRVREPRVLFFYTRRCSPRLRRPGNDVVLPASSRLALRLAGLQAAVSAIRVAPCRNPGSIASTGPQIAGNRCASPPLTLRYRRADAESVAESAGRKRRFYRLRATAPCR